MNALFRFLSTSVAARIVVLVAALVYSLSFTFWNNLADTYYWYNLVPFYQQDALQVFTLWLGYWWQNLTGGGVVTFHLLGWLLGMMSIFLPYGMLLTARSRVDNLYLLSAGVFLLGRWTMGNYNSDATTLFFFVLTAVLIVKYGVGTLSRILVVSIISALAIASRFPNLLLLFLLSGYIIFDGRMRGSSWKRVIVQIFFFVVASAFFYWLTVGLISSRWDVVAFIQANLAEVQSNGIGSHSLGSLLMGYQWSIIEAVTSFLTLLGLFTAIYFFKAETSKSWIPYLVAACMLFALLHRLKSPTLVSVVIISLLTCHFFQQKAWASKLQVVFVVLLGIVTCAGSDTGLFKISPYFACMAPVVFSLYADQLRTRRLLRIYLLTFVASYVYLSVFFIKQFKPTGSYHVPIMHYHCASAFPNLSAMITEADKADWSARAQDIETFGAGRTILLYGTPAAHPMYAILGLKPPYKPDFFQKDYHIGLMGHVVDFASAHPSALVVDYSNSEWLQARMDSIGFLCVKNSPRGKLYIRPLTQHSRP